jgi:hypothetical protein
MGVNMPEYIVKVQVEFKYVVDEVDEAAAEEQAWHWEEFSNRDENVVSWEITELRELEEGEEWDPDIEILRN